MPASIAATSSGASGRVISMPDTSPTNTGWICRISMVTVGCSSLSFRGAHLGRRLHCGQFGAGHGGAAHVAWLPVIVAANAMHGAAVVPDHQIVRPPSMRMNELP